jgi:hypothetical protein
MLLPVSPATYVLSTISPNKSTESLFLVISVVAFVGLAVSPTELSFSVHLVVLPVADISSSVSPFVGSVTFNIVISEIAFIETAVCEVQTSVSMLRTFNENSLKSGSISPGLLTSAVLFIVFPVAFVPKLKLRTLNH